MSAQISLNGVDALRQSLISQISELITPLMRDSGYRKVLDPSKGVLGPTRPLRLWTPETSIELEGFKLDYLIAITEDGLMVDATGHGATTEPMEDFPIEDLHMLLGTLIEMLDSAESANLDVAPASGQSREAGRLLFSTSVHGDVCVIEAAFGATCHPDALEIEARARQMVQDRKIRPGQVWQWEGTFGRYKNGRARWSGKLRPMRVKHRFAAAS